ncbi:uncharacterized protein LOC119662228 [Teleopsis dalmanni]|uniref:uncharacterized protein LOC119662228 n=1 Tax=Teleopsis dalmanni TaxID=139649 RepID=UPI0018CF9BEA|nr:uncharacterized protein LOC119662228 [Teleopsis dalmanni]
MNIIEVSARKFEKNSIPYDLLIELILILFLQVTGTRVVMKNSGPLENDISALIFYITVILLLNRLRIEGLGSRYLQYLCFVFRVVGVVLISEVAMTIGWPTMNTLLRQIYETIDFGLDVLRLLVVLSLFTVTIIITGCGNILKEQLSL